MKTTRDLAAARALLETDPVGNAFVLDRGFLMDGPREVFAVGEPPRAVLSLVRPPWVEGTVGFGLHAPRLSDAKALIGALPTGPFFGHLTDASLLPLLQARTKAFDGGAFWLFRLNADDFVDRESHAVRRLDSEWAPRVAAAWSPEWDATMYVRVRLERGPGFAVFDHGEPVAWALTHVETPSVSIIGLVHVVERCRRQGFARSVISAAVKDVLRRGKVPALHVKTDNEPSLELMPSLGFCKVKLQAFGEGVIA